MHLTETLVALTGIVVTFGVPLALVAIILHYKQRKLRMTHETIARLADKGLPIPPELLQQPRGSSGLRGGLVLIALGVALTAFIDEMGGPWSIGLIPGLMGLALVAAWLIETRRKP